MSWEIRGKVCVVTGANSGIGYAATEALVRDGAHVTMICRHPERARAARARVTRATGVEPELVLCDMASQAEIRRAARTLRRMHPRIDVLINNAGAVHSDRTLSPDGYELTFAVNHLGYFLLTDLLLDVLKNSAPARIINVASTAHRRSPGLDFEDLDRSHRSYDGVQAYSDSKLANILFTRALSGRLEGSGVTVNAVHPGIVATQFARRAHGWIHWAFKLTRPFLLSETKGAETLLYLARSADVSETSGAYFAKGRAIEASPQARDDAQAQRLWDESVRRTQS